MGAQALVGADPETGGIKQPAAEPQKKTSKKTTKK
jgi:hypothetical protein